MDRRRRARLALVLGALLSAGAAAPASALDDEGLRWEVLIDERDAESVPPGSPVELRWRDPTVIDLRVRNDRDEPVTISRVRFEGRVLGLAFFSYTTDVDLELEPGDEGQRVYSLNLQDLYGQATGKLPGRVVLLDGRTEVSTIDVPVHVRAPFRSVYGMFGLGVAAVTLVLLWGALWSLALGRLHANRWRRATALAIPGLGLGFTLTFTVSALGWFLPSAGLWLGLVLACGAAGFVAGYLTPTPDLDDGYPDDELPDASVGDEYAGDDRAGVADDGDHRPGVPDGELRVDDWPAGEGADTQVERTGNSVLILPSPGDDLPEGQDRDAVDDRPGGEAGWRDVPGQR